MIDLEKLKSIWKDKDRYGKYIVFSKTKVYSNVSFKVVLLFTDI